LRKTARSSVVSCNALIDSPRDAAADPAAGVQGYCHHPGTESGVQNLAQKARLRLLGCAARTVEVQSIAALSG
jgi:hypothetical protein